MLDVSQDEELECMKWIEDNRPSTTRASYGRYFAEFLEYAKRKNLHHRSEVAIASFMKYCVTERPRKLGRDTAASIIPAAIAAGLRYTDPSALQSTLVTEMKKSIKRTVPMEHRAKKPITPEMLRQMASGVNVSSLEQTRNYFMILMMTLAMLRESEVVVLQMDDARVEDHPEGIGKVLSIYIPWSKTDQPGDGHMVMLAEMEDYRLCPVTWFTAYTALRDPTAEYLFYSLGSNNLARLSEKTPNHIVKKLVKELGFDESSYGYNTSLLCLSIGIRSHSCRRGGCTAAIDAGVDLRTVSRHGRWRSSAINTYIVDSDQTKLSVSKAITGELD